MSGLITDIDYSDWQCVHQLIVLPNAADESPSVTPVLPVLSNTLTNGLRSSYGAAAHFLPLTPTNIPRNSHRGFFLPRISKYRRGDRFSTWHGARAFLLSPVPAHGGNTTSVTSFGFSKFGAMSGQTREQKSSVLTTGDSSSSIFNVRARRHVNNKRNISGRRSRRVRMDPDGRSIIAIAKHRSILQNGLECANKKRGKIFLFHGRELIGRHKKLDLVCFYR
jgi:hypothetical protein